MRKMQGKIIMQRYQTIRVENNLQVLLIIDKDLHSYTSILKIKTEYTP